MENKENRHSRESGNLPPLELKFTSDGLFEGYASVFGVVDKTNDIVAPGAFKKSLAEHKSAGTLPPLLWQHDPQRPVGAWREMREDARGLYVKGELFSKKALKFVQEGVVGGLSIGYHARASRKDKAGIRILTDVELVEVSLVTFPANEQARVLKRDKLLAATLKAVRAALALKYNHNHLPAGSSEGGRFASGDGSGGGGVGAKLRLSNTNPRASQKPSNLSASPEGVDFIAKREVYKDAVYDDGSGNPTIGYGHKLTAGEEYPDRISHDEALKLLDKDVSAAESAVQRNVIVPLTQHQFDALTSFSFNAGQGALGASTMLKLLNQGDYAGAAGEFSKWNKATNKRTGAKIINEGLTVRRRQERSLFERGDY